MADKMMAYLRSQPEIWQQISSRQAEILQDFTASAQGKKWKRLLAIGSGSSYNAACCVRELYARELGIDLLPCAPTQAELALTLYSPADTAVILISQSGESTSTISVLKQVKQHGFFTIALTQVLNSTVAKGSDVIVDLACGEENVGPKTKGFTSTVLILQEMAFALCNTDAQKTRAMQIAAELRTSFALAAERIEKSVVWAHRMSDTLSTAPHLMLLAEGTNREAMLEGTLKLLETLYIPATSYEFEEYLHGVHCSIGSESYLILVIPDNENRERMLKLAAFNQAHGGKSYIVSTGRPTGFDGELFLGRVDGRYTACYDVLLPMQVVSALVSADKGINCDKPKFPNFNRELGTKNW